MARPQPVPMAVRQQFVAKLAEKGMTPTQFAKKLGVHDSTVLKPLRGNEGISEQKLRRWCDAIGVKYEELNGEWAPASVPGELVIATPTHDGKLFIYGKTAQEDAKEVVEAIKKAKATPSKKPVVATVVDDTVTSLARRFHAVLDRIADLSDSARRFGYA